MSRTKSIDAQIKDVKKWYSKEQKRLESEYMKKINVLYKSAIACENDDFSPHYDKKTGKIEYRRCGCGKYRYKDEFFRIRVVDYHVTESSYDCGYGDYDQLVVEKYSQEYHVCKDCGKMIPISDTYKILERGPEKSRRGTTPPGWNIAPQGWKREVTVIEEKKG